MKYFVTVNGKKFEVVVEPEIGAAGSVATTSNASGAAPAAAVLPPIAAGEEAIVAPMPGTILKVKISEGQAVRKGEVLFILEAMKMENEIMAGRDGVVTKVMIANGTSVNTGDCLARLK